LANPIPGGVGMSSWMCPMHVSPYSRPMLSSRA
jgi:hypothetical protein